MKRILLLCIAIILAGPSCDNRKTEPKDSNRSPEKDPVSFRLLISEMAEDDHGQLWAKIELMNSSAFPVLIMTAPDGLSCFASVAHANVEGLQFEDLSRIKKPQSKNS